MARRCFQVACLLSYQRTSGPQKVSSEEEQHEGQAMRIPVTDHIRLSEFRPSDQAACIQHLNEKDIYERTLRIRCPYSETDFLAWLGIVEKATRQQGRSVHWAIRPRFSVFFSELRWKETSCDEFEIICIHSLSA